MIHPETIQSKCLESCGEAGTASNPSEVAPIEPVTGSGNPCPTKLDMMPIQIWVENYFVGDWGKCVMCGKNYQIYGRDGFCDDCLIDGDDEIQNDIKEWADSYSGEFS